MLLQPSEQGRALQPFVERWEDPSHTATLTEAMARGQFVPVTATQLTPGYSRSAFWLRTRLINTDPYPRTVWLEVGWARLQEVAFYQFEQGRWQVAQAGTSQPFAKRPIDAVQPVFAITLGPGETRELYWRVASSTALSMEPRLWSPEAFRHAESAKRWEDGLVAGGMLMIGLYSLILFLALRERGYVFYGLTTLCFVLSDFSVKGWAFRFLWPQATGWATQAIQFSINLCILFHLLFYRDLLRMNIHMPRWNKLFIAMCGGLVVSTILALGADYTLGAMLGTSIAVLTTVIVPLLCLWMLLRGAAVAWAYLLASVVFLLGNVPRTYQALGWHGLNGLADYVPWATIAYPVLLLAAFTQQVRRVHLQKEQALAELLSMREHERDALEHKVAERTSELAEARDAALAANQAKSRLLAHIGHDLRAPLATIIGYAQLMQQTGVDLQMSRRAIEQNARHQLELIDELLDFAGAEKEEVQLRPAPAYWHAFVESIAQDARQLASVNGNRFELDSDESVPPVLLTDFKRLRQILTNLLSNAAKFTDHGTVRLSVRRLARQEDDVTLRFEVHDSGIGIPAVAMARLFQPFERAENAAGREGTGLGLSIAQLLVRKLGGELTVTSRIGAGSSFAFILHLELSSEAMLLATNAMRSAWVPHATRSLTVLVADDTVSSRELTAHWLQQAGHCVLQAADGDEALQLVQRHAVDAVISDQVMAKTGGWALLAALRKQPEPPPVLLYSAQPARCPEGYPAGLAFDAELLKPADAAQLLAALEHLQPEAPASAIDLEAHATLRELIGQGRLSDIEAWAEARLHGRPEQVDFARQILQAAKVVDFARLAQLTRLKQAAI
ncbi:hybrid sensor histidine kinase/response regulator [Ralstonia sp. 24A2]|uniref:hybrid sensor histidine kinase/response regulator n=1 Tax=Ralstonia sp. 24A2 TaxID=3447364 RepID=UPI003F695C7A